MSGFVPVEVMVKILELAAPQARPTATETSPFDPQPLHLPHWQLPTLPTTGCNQPQRESLVTVTKFCAVCKAWREMGQKYIRTFVPSILPLEVQVVPSVLAESRWFRSFSAGPKCTLDLWIIPKSGDQLVPRLPHLRGSSMHHRSHSHRFWQFNRGVFFGCDLSWLMNSHPYSRLGIPKDEEEIWELLSNEGGDWRPVCPSPLNCADSVV